jgi:hypothetical protein
VIDSEPTSDEEFRAALERLVTTADENDVGVTGGWEVVGDDRPLGVEVYRVEPSE